MSERFRQHLASIETQTDKLLDLDVNEQKAHQLRLGNAWPTAQKRAESAWQPCVPISGASSVPMSRRNDAMNTVEHSGDRGKDHRPCRSVGSGDGPAHLSRQSSTSTTSCRTSDSPGSARRRTRSFSGRSRPTRACSSRCWSSRIPTLPASSGSSTASAAGPTRKSWSQQGKQPVPADAGRGHRPDADRRRAPARVDLHPPAAQGMGRERKGNGRLPPRRSGRAGERGQHPWHHGARTRQARRGLRAVGAIHRPARSGRAPSPGRAS